jgi:hypothetical protein
MLPWLLFFWVLGAAIWVEGDQALFIVIPSVTAWWPGASISSYGLLRSPRALTDPPTLQAQTLQAQESRTLKPGAIEKQSLIRQRLLQLLFQYALSDKKECHDAADEQSGWNNRAETQSAPS